MSLSLRDRMERRKMIDHANEYSVSDDHIAPEVREAPTHMANSNVHDLKTKLHIQLVDRLTEQEEESEYESVFVQALTDEGMVLPKAERDRLWGELRAEIRGFGPIDPLLHDESISEVMVVAPDQVYIERKGKLELTEIRFKDADHVQRIIEKIVAPIGRRIDESVPYVDARLPDGSRVHAIIPPLALKGPCLTIRKFSSVPLQVSDLVRFGTLSPPMAEFLRAAIDARLNIIISGGTGSGKTTTLNVISNFIREDERIITIEDAAELKLQQSHLVTLEARPANVEGRGAITIRDLVRNALRMRPDRIVVGEVRGAEALDMLQAMNTGHDGSLTTAHANTPRDMLRRLETMVMMAGMDLPVRAIREQIASAVDLIVQQSRLSDGGRRVTHISEVLGMEGDQIILQDIFTFEQRGRRHDGSVIGRHCATGMVPACTDAMQAYGIPYRMDWFQAMPG